MKTTKMQIRNFAYERQVIKMLKNGTKVEELIAYSRGYNDALSDYGHITEQEAAEQIEKETKHLRFLQKVVEQGGVI